MEKYTGLDSAFHKYTSLIADIFFIGLLWLATSILVVTIGASTTATYYVFTKKITGHDGYLLRDFFSSFKQNFFKATIGTLFFASVWFIVFLNINILVDENINHFLLIQYFIALQSIIISIYFFPLLARFDMRFFALLKTAFFLANRHFLITFVCVILLVAVILLVMFLPVTFLFAGGLYMYFTSIMFVKIFKKHWIEFNKITEDNEEDKENEDKENEF